MQKLIICGCFILFGWNVNAQNAPSPKASLRIKAYEQSFVSGTAKNPIIEFGGKETPVTHQKNTPDYYLFLITYKVPFVKIERVWLHQKLYTATINKVQHKPVVLITGKTKDTLVKYTDELVWQLTLKGPDSTNIKPKKDIAKLVAENELVLRLNDKNGKLYTRTIKAITRLEPAKGM